MGGDKPSLAVAVTDGGLGQIDLWPRGHGRASIGYWVAPSARRRGVAQHIFPFGATSDMTPTDIDDVYAVNVKAPYLLVAALAPAMAERGHGAVINVTTMVAEFGMAGMGLYGSSKAAMVLLTKSWAAEFGPAGVRVNAVSPGPTRTEGTAGMGEGLDQLAAGGPAGRPGQPDEIAAAITFLATEQASFIHGTVLPVDGGRIAV